MIAESARDVPAWSSRSASPTLSIALDLEKLQSALQKSEIDRATTWPTAERAQVEPGLSTGTRLYVACRSTPCFLAVWSRWAESSTALGGFRVLKKTSEAPYTTKVNIASVLRSH